MKQCPRCIQYTCTKCAETDMLDCPKCNRKVCISCIYVCECCSQKCCLDCVKSKYTCRLDPNDDIEYERQYKASKYVCNAKECKKAICGGCSDDEKERMMDRCNDCSEELCFSCRYSGMKKSWRNACRGCLEMIGPTIDKKLGENL